jgi:hypothetical protein
VVAISEDLYSSVAAAGIPVGVSVLCPGWVHTRIADAGRNWPERLGDLPPRSPVAGMMGGPFRQAIGHGLGPAAVADQVADAVVANRFWIFTDPAFTEVALRRWHSIAKGRNP